MDTSFSAESWPNFWIYFTPVGSSRVERNGANPGDGSESMTDLSNIGSNMRTKIDRGCERNIAGERKLDDFSLWNESG